MCVGGGGYTVYTRSTVHRWPQNSKAIDVLRVKRKLGQVLKAKQRSKAHSAFSFLLWPQGPPMEVWIRWTGAGTKTATLPLLSFFRPALFIHFHSTSISFPRSQKKNSPALPSSLSLSLSLSLLPPPQPCKRVGVLLLRRVGDVEREWECCTYGTTKEALLLLISSWQARIVERTSPLPSSECFPTSNVISCVVQVGKSLKQDCTQTPPACTSIAAAPCRWTCRRRSCTA